jgi:RNA 3'-terminal phosphate cyclase (ATP)
LLEIDGAQGPGGGQLLRTSLSLSILLRKPFRMTGIRAGRKNPGLQAQHLTAVKAAAEVSRARVHGADLNSEALTFEPERLEAGRHRFDIGTAGSTALVLQTLLPALLFAGKPSELEIRGGTANPFAPSALYLEQVFLPTLARMGAKATARVERWGFYPAGGGVLRARVEPANGLTAIDLRGRGRLEEVRGYAVVANLPAGVAEREKTRALKVLAEASLEARITLERAEADGPGNELFLLARYANARAGFSSLGEKGKPAEQVAEEAARELAAFHASGASADAHLADQLLLYAALAGGESRYTTPRVTSHLVTNAWLVEKFLPRADIDVEGEEHAPGEVRVTGAGFGGARASSGA